MSDHNDNAIRRRRGRVVDSSASDGDDESGMDYEPSESAAQETRESTAAPEAGNVASGGTTGRPGLIPGVVDALQALLEGAIEELDSEELEEEEAEEADNSDTDDPDEDTGHGNIDIITSDDRHMWNDDDDDDDDDYTQVITMVGNTFGIRLPRARVRQIIGGPKRDMCLENLEPWPSQEGRELMANGEFGFYEFPETVRVQRKKRRRSDTPPEFLTNDDLPEEELPDAVAPIQEGEAEYYESSCKRQRIPMDKRLLSREMGIYNGEPARRLDSLVMQSMIPTSTDTVLHFDSRCYSGQFSEDGDFFYCCSQDMMVRMYDTSNPNKWKHYKSAEYPGGQWTITDATLSPDNRQLAYSSLDSCLFMAKTQSQDECSDYPVPLDFSNGPAGCTMRSGTPIWSIRFSGDGKEIVAGAKDNSIYVYNIEAQKPTLKLRGHEDDVNAVCYGDKTSPHIIFSGSDDSTIKVWDRRSMSSGREAGAFLGHMEGLTYIDSKGDGRYVLSNSKDQTMKLWDIRKLVERSRYEQSGPPNYASNFDYRLESYDYRPIRKHPNDNSVVTFRGHRVLKTLIRCHFSPPVSSGSRYVYTGSEDGRVFIYNLDATIAGIIDVQDTTFDHRPRPQYSWRGYAGFTNNQTSWETCTRDVAWHPSVPMIVSTSWSGYNSSQGSVAIHGYDDKVRGEGMTRDDFGYWNTQRQGLRRRGSFQLPTRSPTRADEELRPLRSL